MSTPSKPQALVPRGPGCLHSQRGRLWCVPPPGGWPPAGARTRRSSVPPATRHFRSQAPEPASTSGREAGALASGEEESEAGRGRGFQGRGLRGALRHCPGHLCRVLAKMAAPWWRSVLCGSRRWRSFSTSGEGSEVRGGLSEVPVKTKPRGSSQRPPLASRPAPFPQPP